MKLYKLQKGDYDALFLLMSPEDIKKEFGARSWSSRNIRNYFSSEGHTKLNMKRKALKEEALDRAEPWQAFMVDETLEELKIERVERLWARIKDIEQEWDSM